MNGKITFPRGDIHSGKYFENGHLKIGIKKYNNKIFLSGEFFENGNLKKGKKKFPNGLTYDGNFSNDGKFIDGNKFIDKKFTMNFKFIFKNEILPEIKKKVLLIEHETQIKNQNKILFNKILVMLLEKKKIN